jgi:hypothetical protein
MLQQAANSSTLQKISWAKGTALAGLHWAPPLWQWFELLTAKISRRSHRWIENTHGWEICLAQAQNQGFFGHGECENWHVSVIFFNKTTKKGKRYIHWLISPIGSVIADTHEYNNSAAMPSLPLGSHHWAIMTLSCVHRRPQGRYPRLLVTSLLYTRRPLLVGPIEIRC